MKPELASELAVRIAAERPAVREALLLALDDWSFSASYAEMSPSVSDLKVIATAADKDPWRKRLRETDDPAELLNLSAESQQRLPPASSITLLADRLELSNHGGDAIKLLRRARGRYPADFWIHFDLGNFFGEVKSPTDAELEERIGCYRAALALRPRAAAAHNNLGLALADKYQLDEAIAEYRLAIEMDPKDPMAHTNLGAALAGKRQFEAAIVEFRTAIQLDSKFAGAHYNLALALSVSNQLDEAIAEFRMAVELDPQDPDARIDLGNALKDKNNLEEAIVQYRLATDVDPKNHKAHYGLGYVLHLNNQVDEAIAAYRRSIEIDPTSALAHKNLGAALLENNLWDEAIAECQLAIQISPRDADAHNNLGAALAAKKRLDEAIAEYRFVIEIDPTDATSYYSLGMALAEKKRFDEAIVEYGRALEIDPTLAWAHAKLGSALRATGEFSKAIERLRRASELFDAGSPARNHCAELLTDIDRLIALEKRVPSILAATALPLNNTERLEFAEVCYLKRQFGAAAELYSHGFAVDSNLAEDLKAGWRYNAACSAALASGGHGNLDEEARAKLRKQVVEWLRADLDLWQKLLQSGKAEKRWRVETTLRHWQGDADLAGLRDPQELEKLPAPEREAFQKLWADVAALLEQAAAKP